MGPRSDGKPPKYQDSVKEFEKALEESSRQHFVLKLYVAGAAPKSAQAVANLRAICEEALSGRYELEVIDIYQQPEQAKPQQIVVAPTLIRQLPAPVRKIIGDLSNKHRVLVGLDLVPKRMAE